MAELKSNIPTLTNIMHKGNDNMLNHFDAHQFEVDEIESNTITENASVVENAEITDIPSIKLDQNSTTELPDQDFSEAMLFDHKQPVEEKPAELELKDKIDQAMNEIMPEIETRIKEQLYKKLTQASD